MSDKETGLYSKFRVERTDGQSMEGRKHHKCQYFVLDLNHDKFCVSALLTYAKSCAAEYPKLAKDIIDVMIPYAVGTLKEVHINDDMEEYL